MPDVPRSHLIAYALAALAVLGFGWRQVAHSRAADIPSGVPIEAGATPAGTTAPAATGGPADGADGAASTPATAGAGGAPGSGDVLVVHVAGWVRRPGVYRLAKGLRVDDAVRAAGGARRGADLSQLNLAMELEDGRQILVARSGAGPPGTSAPAGAAPGAPAAGGSAPAGAAPAAATVNLNTATVEQLDTLNGVGPVTAANIVAYRDEHGGFGTIDELGEIPGIGPVRLESLREQVTL